MFSSTMILAYFSPETMLPLSSLIATLAGFALLVKRSSVRFVVQCCRSAFRRGSTRSIASPPHFAKENSPAKQDVRS